MLSCNFLEYSLVFGFFRKTEVKKKPNLLVYYFLENRSVENQSFLKPKNRT
jgi:hypothetical protein